MRLVSGINRRTFIADLGKGAFAIAVLGSALQACSSDNTQAATTTGFPSISTTPAPSSGSGSPTAPDTTPAATSTTAATAASTSTTVPPIDASDPVVWERVNLGFVSAYILARAGEAMIVDTGVSGSEGAIEASLQDVGLEWGDVAHVVLTHLHPDHQGSFQAVLNLASDAAGYAGAADIPGIASPRELKSVGDGDTVFGLEIINTPGHTPGHICVLDPGGRLLVAGDALNGSNGGVVGANQQFSSDMVSADESVRKLAALAIDTIVFGHGEPIETGAGDLLAALAASL